MKDKLLKQQKLNFGEKLYSSNGYYYLTMQTDGNLVLYNNKNHPIWASNTNGTDARYAIMQGDGNLVLYNENGRPIWATGTDGHPNSFLIIQDDRNLVVYQNETPIWASNTNLSDRLTTNQVLNFGEKLYSSNGYYYLTMQTDGNLVLYNKKNHPIWASNTNGTDARYAIMQGDGNLVLYNENGRPIWATATDGNPNSFLIIQDDRNLVIYQDETPIWASGTNIIDSHLKRRLKIIGDIFVRDDDEGTNAENDRNISGAIEFDDKIQGSIEFIKRAPNGQIGKLIIEASLNSDDSISINRSAFCTDSNTQTKNILLKPDTDYHEKLHCEHNPTIGARNWADFNIHLKNESFFSDKILNSITLRHNIVTRGIDAFGGWVEVTINRDGNIRFKGHCHNSGFESYNFNIRTIVHSDAPIVLAMQKSGYIEGTIHPGLFDAPRRDFEWDETTFNPNVQAHFDHIIKNIKMDVYSADSGDISGIFEDITNFVIKWIAGSVLINPLTGLIIFVGIEIGSIATGAGFAGGARVIENILWCAGPFGTLYAIAADGIAKLGENERELTDYEYNFANSNIFKGTLPAKQDLILTDTIGGNDRAFTMPRFDGKITINMGEDGFRDPINYRLNSGTQKGQIFIHELTHAWQIKNSNWGLALMASALASKICEIGGGDPYDFGTDTNKPFGDFNLEQQAHIVDEWFASCAKDSNGNIDESKDYTKSPWYHYIEGNIRVGKPS
ncbi:MAG: hypothetical protein K1X55_04620 [Chitinophagales bacterium]|nr:hypothetical protein [Chitinophagales bacterium]